MMKPFIHRLQSFVILIATTVFTLAIGTIFIYSITFIEERGRWEKLDTPPGDIVKLLAADEGDVAVETANGAIYQINCRTRGQDDFCVREVESLGPWEPNL